MTLCAFVGVLLKLQNALCNDKNRWILYGETVAAYGEDH